MICPACKGAIALKEPTANISVGTLEHGKKSMQYYHSATMEESVIVHYKCVFLYFNPFADKEMYDHFYERVAEQVRAEEYDQLKEQAFDEVATDINTLCPECRHDRTALVEEDPDRDLLTDEEICESCGSAAVPVCPDCGSTRPCTHEFVDEEEDPTVAEQTQYARES